MMVSAFLVLLLLPATPTADGGPSASGSIPAPVWGEFTADEPGCERAPLDAAEEEAEESEDDAILGHPVRGAVSLGTPTFAVDLAPAPSLPSARCWHRTLRGPPLV
jgi:hypothetical protein